MLLADAVYLDHAGATLYADSQITDAQSVLLSGLYGNPHSRSPSSVLTSHAVEAVRREVAELFNAPQSEYSVVFTSGATAGLKMVGDTFPWTSDSAFCFLEDNHTSVVGLRSYVLASPFLFCLLGYLPLLLCLDHSLLK